MGGWSSGPAQFTQPQQQVCELIERIILTSMPSIYTQKQYTLVIYLVSWPAPPRMCEKGGSGVLNDFFCHSSPIRELESDCRTSSSTRSSMPAVRCTCTGNAIITFFMPFNPAPCDKKFHSEHQTLFPLFGGGVWG